jgi:hypothetical protein
LLYDGTSPLTGTNPTLRCQELWKVVSNEYKSLGVQCRLTRLQISMFCDIRKPRTEYPILKSKAAETRALLPALVRICRTYNRGSATDTLRLQCCEAFQEFNNVLHAAGAFLTAEEHTRSTAAAQAALYTYMQLSFLAAEAGQFRYNVVNKHHFLGHIATSAQYLNPRLTWCYGWEDLIGRGQRVAAKCKSGTRPLLVPVAFMQRYRAALHCALRARPDA